METHQKIYETAEVMALTKYSNQRLSQLRLKGIAGEEGEGKDWWYRRGVAVFTEQSIQKILAYKKDAKKNITGRPRKKIAES